MAGNFNNRGDEIFSAVELKVVELHGDGEVGNRVPEHERVDRRIVGIMSYVMKNRVIASRLAGSTRLNRAFYQWPSGRWINFAR